jgi:hypothetical protein
MRAFMFSARCYKARIIQRTRREGRPRNHRRSSPLEARELKSGESMRDIRGDLQGRAERLKAQISAENARFETLLGQLRTKRESNLEHLRAQLRLANKLIEFTAWHDKLRAELAARIAAAEAAESLIRKSLGTGR